MNFQPVGKQRGGERGRLLLALLGLPQHVKGLVQKLLQVESNSVACPTSLGSHGENGREEIFHLRFRQLVSDHAQIFLVAPRHLRALVLEGRSPGLNRPRSISLSCRPGGWGRGITSEAGGLRVKARISRGAQACPRGPRLQNCVRPHVCSGSQARGRPEPCTGTQACGRPQPRSRLQA